MLDDVRYMHVKIKRLSLYRKMKNVRKINQSFIAELKKNLIFS